MLNTIELWSRAVEPPPVGHRRHRRLQHHYRCQTRSNVFKKQDFFRSICYVEVVSNLGGHSCPPHEKEKKQVKNASGNLKT
jgi:hypothetical protein